MKQSVQVRPNHRTEKQSSQVQNKTSYPVVITEADKRKYYGTLTRKIDNDQVLGMVDNFQRLEFSRDEVNGLLDLGASLIQSEFKDGTKSKLADNFQQLVSAAKHKLEVAINSIHEDVYNIEPRVDDGSLSMDQLDKAIAREVAL
jgi:hypothetical protein